jgi:hypothetical protein
VKDSRTALADALRNATIMLSAPGRMGTGFFVAPGQVLTCAHVIAAPASRPPESVTGQWGATAIKLQVTHYMLDYDLAILTMAGQLDHPVACTAAPMEPGDELWACGHPMGTYRHGDVIRLFYDGPSTNTDGLEFLRATEGRAIEGFSGSPVLNWRTGGVCGILRRADAPPGGPPGVRIIGAARILEAFRQQIKPPSELSQDRAPWYKLLDDSQIAAGRWCYPGHRLQDYLKAARMTAREHPYRFALPNAPQLSTVYLRQQATRVIGGNEATGDEDGNEVRVKDRPVPADLVLDDGDQGCVFVIGGPGSGKSSLLRYLSEVAAGRWLDGVAAQGVPILVPAVALAADVPLAEALAGGVTSALGARLADRDLADLFENEPIPGVPWIVLVDGVDEILAPERRRRVLETVRFWTAHSSLYRFLVTSRPLPKGQLDALYDEKIPIYEIEPFSQDQLPELARRWFSALQMPNPEDLLPVFLERLESSQLRRLADIPLIATMLCVVFASKDGRDLPLSRVGLYEEFITLLMTKRYMQINALERLQQWIHPYGKTAEMAVDTLMAGFRPLLESIADERLQGRGPEALLDAVVIQVRDLPPAHLPSEQWRMVVEESLRLSGLVIEKSGQLSFFHFTIEEYLAVCGRKIPSDIIPEVLEQGRNGRNSVALLRAGVLIDRSPDQARDAAAALTDAGLKGLTFLAALVNEGTQFPTGALDKAQNELKRYSATPDGQWSDTTYEAAEALALIDPALGFRYWQQFADDKNLARREVAAGMMLRISYHRAAPILEPVALTAETPLRIRQAIVYGVAVVNRQRSDELLTKIILSPLVDNAARHWAIELVRERNYPAYIDLLGRVAGESGVPGSYRRWAAEELYQQGEDDELGAAAIAVVARDPTVPGVDRFYAVATLINQRPYRGIRRRELAFELFAVIASDPAAESTYRMKAARELVPDSPSRARSALSLLADDQYANGLQRARAAALLIDLDPSRGIEAAAKIAADPTTNGDGRVEAALALAWTSRPRAAIALLDITADRRVDAEYRIAAANNLNGIDRDALRLALQIIVSDRQINEIDRVNAGLRLTELSPQSGCLALETLVDDATVTPFARLEIACRLIELKSDKGAAALPSLSANRHLDDTRRLHAAMEFGQSQPLAALAADPTVDGLYRVRAAFELAALERHLGTEALAALCKDPTTEHIQSDFTFARQRRQSPTWHAAYLRLPDKASPSKRLSGLDPSRITGWIGRFSKNFQTSRLGTSDSVVGDGYASETTAESSQFISRRVQAARLLSQYDHLAAVDQLVALARDADEDVASQAITALTEIPQS